MPVMFQVRRSPLSQRLASPEQAGSVLTSARLAVIGTLGLLLIACGDAGSAAPTATGQPHPAPLAVCTAGGSTAPSAAAQPQPPLKAPEGIAIGSDGSVYISDYEAGYVFRLQPDCSLTIVAGTGGGDEGGDGGSATKATLSGPSGLVVDQNGNLFVADHPGHRVRRIDSRGIITTFAGNGAGSFSGDGGLATAASLHFPLGLVFDKAGALYVGDEDNSSVRRIDPNGTISSVDSSTLPAPLWRPGYLAVDSAGNLYVSDRGGHGFGGGCRIIRVSQARVQSVVAGNGTCGFKGDGGRATAAELNDPNGLAFDSAGNLYVSDSNNQRIRRIGRNGVITTVAGTGIAGFSGDGGLGTSAQLNNPFGIGIAPGDMLYISEGGGHRVRLLRLSNDLITTVIQ